MSFSDAALKHLDDLGVDPMLAAALPGLAEVDDEEGTFEIEYDSVNGPVAHRWRPGAAPEPWPDGARRGLWRPAGDLDAGCAIAVVGAGAGLRLAGLLLAAVDGELRHRPGLPDPLADAVPVVLPETAPELPLEWLAGDDGAVEFITDLSLARDAHLAFLAVAAEAPGGRPEVEGEVRQFVDAAHAVGEAIGLTVAPILLPHDVGLLDPLDGLSGHGRTYALAGLLRFWRTVALNPPPPQGVPND